MNPYLERARMLYSRARYEEAERELGMALTQQPDDPWAIVLLAACRSAQKDFRQASELVRQALSLAPDEPGIYSMVSEIRSDQNDNAGALGAINQAITLDPTQASFYLQRASIHIEKSQWESADADCRQALELDPNEPSILSLHAMVQRARGNLKDADAISQQALAIDPENAFAHSDRGYSALFLGNQEPAESHFREALRLEPNSNWARLGLLESMKSNASIYRWYLQFIYWFSRQSGTVWLMLLALAGAVYAMLRVVGHFYPAIAPVVASLIFAEVLLVAAVLFHKPLSNLLLAINSDGRRSMTSREVLGSIFVSVWLVALAGILAVDSVTSIPHLFFGGVVVALAGFPIAFNSLLDPGISLGWLCFNIVVVVALAAIVFMDSIEFIRLEKNVSRWVSRSLFYSPLATVYLASRNRQTD